MLTFCKKCGGIMVLKEKNGREGVYECRRCGLVMPLKVERLVLTEKIKEESPMQQIQKRFDFLI